MTTTDTITTVACPLGCARTVNARPAPAAENHIAPVASASPVAAGVYRKEIVYDKESRDYAAYLDGELVGFARTYHEAEVTLDQLVFELVSGSYFTAAQVATPGHSPLACPRCDGPTTDDRRPTTDDDPFNDGPSQEEQAASAARWMECEGGWEQYTPDPFDETKTVRLFQPRQCEPAPPPATSIATLVCLLRATAQAWLEVEQPTPYDAPLARLTRQLHAADEPVASLTTQQDDDRRALQTNICGEFLTARYHDDPASFLAKLASWDSRVQVAVTQAVAAHLGEPVEAIEQLWAESRGRLAAPVTPLARLYASAGWAARNHADNWTALVAQLLVPLAHLGATINPAGDYVFVQTRRDLLAPATEQAGAALLCDALNALAVQLPFVADSIGAALHIGERLYTYGRSN